MSETIYRKTEPSDTVRLQVIDGKSTLTLGDYKVTFDSPVSGLKVVNSEGKTVISVGSITQSTSAVPTKNSSVVTTQKPSKPSILHGFFFGCAVAFFLYLGTVAYALSHR